MSGDAAAGRSRLDVLTRQLASTSIGSSSSSSSSSGHGAQSQHQQQLARQPTAGSAVRSLPKFDPYIMETYLDDLREMKRQIYDLFKFKPELLPGPELSKGAQRACARCCNWARACVRGACWEGQVTMPEAVQAVAACNTPARNVTVPQHAL
jgi:hypothetical protein